MSATSHLLATNHITYDTPGRRAGLAIIASSGLLSSLSTAALLTYFLYCHLRTRTPHYGLSSPLIRGVNGFITSTLGKYLFFLILCDFCQGTAFVTNYWWAVKGFMDESAPCVFQGALSQVGDLGAALWSNVIAFQTFALLFMQYKPPRSVELSTTIVIWTTILLLPILGPTALQDLETSGPFWGLSGAWCWVGGGYQLCRLLYLYVWVFLNLFCCFAIYSLIYLKFAGYVDYAPDRWCKTIWYLRRSSSQNNRREENKSPFWQSTHTHSVTSAKTGGGGHGHQQHHISIQGFDSASVTRHAARVARRLMWYPIVYAIVTIPVAICRLGVLVGWTPPFWLFVFAGTCFSGSGLSNTLLFLFTRHAFIQRTLQHPPVMSTREVDVRIDDPLPSSSSRSPPASASIYTPTSAAPFFPFDNHPQSQYQDTKAPAHYHYVRTSTYKSSDPFNVTLTPNPNAFPLANASPNHGGGGLLRPPPSPYSPHNSTGGFNYYSYQYRQPRSPDARPSLLEALVISPPSIESTLSRARAV